MLVLLLISCSGGEKEPSRKVLVKENSGEFWVKIDKESIETGREFFQSKCSFCHAAKSIKTIQGPGLRHILKRRHLPVSGKLATPENVDEQKRRPYASMPSFNYPTDEEVDNIIAYLYTL